jgi:uncharacterized protein Yka (UPF0111/DUF47 family)
MGKEREEQVLEHLAEFADQVVVIVEKLQDVVERFRRRPLMTNWPRLPTSWTGSKPADDTKEAILDRVSLGGVYPIHRADLARLVGSVDSIANLAAGAADRISMAQVFTSGRYERAVVEMAKVDLEAVRVLRDAVVAMGTDLGQVIKLAGMVDKIESRADEVFARYITACSRWTPTSRRFINSRRSSSA